MGGILVIGGAGFIGSHIVDKLLENGEKVIVVDNLSTGNIQNINKDAIFYNIDIRDKCLINVFEKEKPDYVIHHAAQVDIKKSFDTPIYDGDVNIIGTINLLDCCKANKIKKIIYASSAAVYGNPEYLPIDEQHGIMPMSFYGISKHTPERYISLYSRIYGFKYTILRYANVYGLRQAFKGEGGVISIFLDKLMKGESPCIFGDGIDTRDYIYIDDVVAANMAALKYGDNEIFNIGTGVSTSVNTLCKIIQNILNIQRAPIYKEPRNGDISHSCFNINKAIGELKWRPRYNIEEGIRMVISNYYQHYNEAAVSIYK